MSNLPLVSIIVPTYKRSTFYLKRAVLSLMKQTYENIEIIVVDDNGLPDLGTFRFLNKELIDGFKDDRIKLIVNDANVGGAKSRNNGILSAKGKYVTFLDDDDEYLPPKIHNQVSFMEANDLDCSFTDLSIYNEEGLLIDRRTREDISSFDKEYLLKYHLTRQIAGTETFMVKKDLLTRIGSFSDVSMGQEYYLMYKILQAPNVKIAYLKTDDIKAYRSKIESLSNGKNKIVGEKAIFEFRKKHFAILSRKEINYVKTRHRAVMAVAYKRNGNYIRAFLFFVSAVFTNPFLSIKEGVNFRKRIKKN